MDSGNRLFRDNVFQDLAGVAQQSISLEGYRSGKLSVEQVRRLLRFESRFQVHAFLKAHQVLPDYGEEGLEKDLKTARKFSATWLSSQTPRPSTT